MGANIYLRFVNKFLKIKNGFMSNPNENKIADENEEKKETILVAVTTTAGSWPKTGFEKVPLHQKVKIFLKKAADELMIVSTEGWIAKVDNREIQVEESYEQNQLSGEVTI